MKKIIILLGCLSLCGCANTEVSCVREDSTEEGQMKEIQKILFVNNKIDEYNINIQFKVNDNVLEYKDIIFNSLEDSFDKYDEMDGIKYDVLKKDKYIKISISGDYDKMSDDLGLKDARINEVIEVLEDDGYTCKY